MSTHLVPSGRILTFHSQLASSLSLLPPMNEVDCSCSPSSNRSCPPAAGFKRSSPPAPPGGGGGGATNTGARSLESSCCCCWAMMACRLLRSVYTMEAESSAGSA